MAYGSMKELTVALSRAFSSYTPTVNEDVTDKGENLTLFVIPHPTEARYSVAVEAKEAHGQIICALWFGSVSIASTVPAEQIIAAVEEILSDRIVAVVRYKNRKLYDARHPSGWVRVFQLTDDQDSDEAALTALLARLETPPTLLDRLPGGFGAGVFEIARWDDVTVTERTTGRK